MEPFAASAAAAVIRPASASTSEASTVLRDGRIVAAEVLNVAGDGRLLLALGRHRVPAETALELEPGATFLARVQGEGDEAVLRILGAGDPIVAQLLAALRAVVGEDHSIGELLQLLAARISAEASAPGAVLEDLRALFRAHVFDPKSVGSELTGMFARAGVRYEALLAQLVRSGVSREKLAEVRLNLKHELLRAFGKLDDGPVREAVGRLLTALEAEQLLNLARQSAGDPSIWSFPVHDADGWTTAQLVVPPEADEERRSSHGDEEPERSVTLGVSFSRLGPVRAELTLSSERLSVRLFVTRAELATQIHADSEELMKRLGRGAREVQIFVRVAPPEAVEVEAHPLDIRFLRDHHLMDVRG